MLLRAQPDDGRGLVVFVHGSTLHQSSWLPWAQLFNDNGYESVAVTWTGEPLGEGPARWSDMLRPGPVRLSRVIARVHETVSSLSRPSIVIGHGTGALLVEASLGHPLVAAGIAIAPTLRGPLPTVRTALEAYRDLRSRSFADEQPSSRASFHRWYANEVSREASDLLYDTYVAPVQVRRLGRGTATSGRLDARDPHRPLLLLSAGRDRIVAEASVASRARRWRSAYPDETTDHYVFPRRCHALVIDEGWSDVANHCLDWLTTQGL